MICGGSFAVWDSDRYKFVYVTGADGVTEEEYVVCPRCLNTEAYRKLVQWAEESEMRKEMREQEKRVEMMREFEEKVKEETRFWVRVWVWGVLIVLILLSFLLG